MPISIANGGTILDPKLIGLEGRIPLFSQKGETVWYDGGYVYSKTEALTSTSTPLTGNRDGEEVTVLTLITGKTFALGFLSLSAAGDTKWQGFYSGSPVVASPVPGAKFSGLDVGTVQGRFIYKGRKSNGTGRYLYIPRAEISGNGTGQEQNQDGLIFTVNGLALPAAYTPSSGLMSTPAKTPFGYVITLDDWKTQEAALLDAIDADSTAAVNASGFTAVKAGTNATLAWTAPSGTRTGYRIDRKIGGAAFIALATLGDSATGYTDTSVPAGSVIYKLTTLGVFTDSAGIDSTPALAYP